MLEGSIDFRTRDGAAAHVAYRRAGHGPCVVLIHGVGLRKDVWDPQLEALAVDHDAIAVDMLGHGASSLPPEKPHLADYASAVLAVLDGLGIARAHVVGHSMGALVALEFALAFPGRTAGVVAVSAVFCRTAEQRASIAARVDDLRGGESLPDWAGTLSRWFGSPVPAHLRATAERTRTLLEEADPLGYARTYRLFASSDAEHGTRLRQLNVPTLFVTGADDANSLPAMSEAMARLVPRGRTLVVPGTRHMLPLTHADEFNRELRTFLEASAETGPVFSVDPRALRRALGSFLTGVTVVATVQPDGAPRGFTANSFTSVSLDPPLVLICIAKTASSCAVFTSAGHFSVNILAEQQIAESGRFASKSPDKFAGVAWRPGPTGSPVLDGVAAWLDCSRHAVIDAGDHTMLVGRVEGFSERAVNPLGYCRGAHVTFGLQLDALAASGGRTLVGAILERDNSIVLVDDGAGGLDIPKGAAVGAATDPASLKGTLWRLCIDAELGFLFAVYEDPARGSSAMSIVYRGQLKSAGDVAAPCVLVPMDDVPWARVRDAALATMLRRYIAERQQDLFGIYVGDAERGIVRSVARAT